MSNLVQLRPPPHDWVPPALKPLDQAVWNAWISKGRARDALSSASRLRWVKWGSAATLLVAAMVWSHLGPYTVVMRLLVAFGGIAVMLQCLSVRQYTFAAVSALLALIYNPVAPLFSFVGDWQRGFVLASAGPFIIGVAASRTARRATR